MTLQIADRVKETSTTTGTGPFALAGAMIGYRTFATVCATNDTCYYAAQLVDANGVPLGQWEVGLGTYSAANTLTRTTILSSSSGGAAVNWAAGTKQVWIDVAAAQLANIAAANGTVTSVGFSAPAEFVVTGAPVITASNIVLARVAGTKQPIVTPGGRITPSSATPVYTGGTSASVVYYTPYIHDLVPIYDGVSWQNYTFSELSQAVTDTTKSPTATLPNALYDMFVWNDAGTLRCTRGWIWATNTNRGTGGGTAELVRQDGIWMNAQIPTNGPAIRRGTYVGTIRTNNSGLVDWYLGGIGAGGYPFYLHFWNMYNRVHFSGLVQDNTDNWTYNAATWRMANGTGNMRANFVRGMDEDLIDARYDGLAYVTAAFNAAVAVGLDSTTGGFQTTAIFGNVANILVPMVGLYTGAPGIGAHFLQALEYSGGANALFFGDNGTPSPPGYILSGLYMSGWF